MTTYEKIRLIRNTILYNGFPPLEFGCQFKIIDIDLLEDFSDEVYTMINVRETREFEEKDSGYCTAVDEGKEFIYDAEDFSAGFLFEEGKIESIGKDVTLQDIITILLLKEGSEDKTIGLLRGLIREIDLSSDIKEQNDEFLKMVYKLIK